MNSGESRFEIPKNIERYMAVLSRMYEREGQRQFQEIIVNSQTVLMSNGAATIGTGALTAMPST
jgi:hypothetical protein